LVTEAAALLLAEVEREAHTAVNPTLEDLAQSPYSGRCFRASHPIRSVPATTPGTHPDHGPCGSKRSEQCDRRNRSNRPTFAILAEDQIIGKREARHRLEAPRARVQRGRGYRRERRCATAPEDNLAAGCDARPRRGRVEAGSHRTLRWREMDSNHWSLLTSRGSCHGKFETLQIPAGCLSQRGCRLRLLRKREAWLGSSASLWAKPHPWRRADTEVILPMPMIQIFGSNEFRRREVGSKGIRLGDACCADGAKARR
jgi:hypothetical protein